MFYSFEELSMNCALCGNQVAKKKDEYTFVSRTLGVISIPDINYEECLSCGEKLLSPTASEEVLKYVREKEQIAIENMPVVDFITAGEAANILGVTKQAFSKSPKIKRGLIYNIQKGSSRLFLRKSVELFQEKGNGKFLLPQKKRYDKTEVTKAVPRYTDVKYINRIIVINHSPEPTRSIGFDPTSNIHYGPNVTLSSKRN